jgi:hypothetical protein
MAIRVSSSDAGTNKSAGMILATACIVAVADGLAAIALTFFLHDRPPIIVFQYIASGLLVLRRRCYGDVRDFISFPDFPSLVHDLFHHPSKTIAVYF